MDDVQLGREGIGEMRPNFLQPLLEILTEGVATTEAGSLFQYFTILTKCNPNDPFISLVILLINADPLSPEATVLYIDKWEICYTSRIINLCIFFAALSKGFTDFISYACGNVNSWLNDFSTSCTSHFQLLT